MRIPVNWDSESAGSGTVICLNWDSNPLELGRGRCVKVIFMVVQFRLPILVVPGPFASTLPSTLFCEHC